MRRRILVSFLLVLAIAAAAGAKRAAPAPGPPRLVVIVAVDGLSWSRLEAWRPWFTRGLKRLLDEGAVATECRYPHADTETGPGHASLSTGAPPRVHGIALNTWYELAPGGSKMKEVYCVDDASPKHLRVPTLADALTAADGRARVVSISLKDRAAILLAGRDPRHAVYWYAPETGTFVTGAAFDGASPVASVVARFNASKGGANIASRYGTTVSRLPVPAQPPTAVSDDGVASHQDAVVGHGFPIDLAKSRFKYTEALPWTTLGDRLLVDLALDLVAADDVALGRDGVPDVLAISFSSNDYVAHDYGPQSLESLEVSRGLDVELGRLLDELTRRFGREAIDLALSADHGMLPLPESQPDVKRVSRAAILSELNGAVVKELRLDPAATPIFRMSGG